MGETRIEWTDATWNPITGCSKVSPGCANCYAEALTRRFADVWHVPDLPWTPANASHNVVLHPERLDQPLHWRRPRMVFVNSMSDLFHEQVPDEFISQVFDVMAEARHHTFQVLTKRPERMRDFRQAWHAAHPECAPLPNVWLGTSIENRRFVSRSNALRDTPAAVRFVSAEPLLGPLINDGNGSDPEDPDGPWPWADGYVGIDLELCGIDWLIAGGESGRGCRPCRTDWLRDLRDVCDTVATAFFLKQLGGHPNKRGGDQAILDGRRHTSMPTAVGAAA